MTWISFTVLGWLLPPQPLLLIGRLPTAPLESTSSQLSWSAYQELSLHDPGGLQMVRSVLCLKVEMSSIYATLPGKRPRWSRQSPGSSRPLDLLEIFSFPGTSLSQPSRPSTPAGPSLRWEGMFFVLMPLLDGILARIKHWLSQWEQLCAEAFPAPFSLYAWPRSDSALLTSEPDLREPMSEGSCYPHTTLQVLLHIPVKFSTNACLLASNLTISLVHGLLVNHGYCPPVYANLCRSQFWQM